MSLIQMVGPAPRQVCLAALPAARGRQVAGPAGFYSRGLLPTDGLGNFVLTLTNVVVGSVVGVEVASSGAQITSRTATSSTESFSVPSYAPGTAANYLRIKVRKGSGSPYFRPYETLATAFVGSQDIFVSQIADE